MVREYVINIEDQKSVKDMEKLSENAKLNMLKEAKPGTWYDGWVPYCCHCSTMRRMRSRKYGFQCPVCQNMIGFDLQRLKESPLNEK